MSPQRVRWITSVIAASSIAGSCALLQQVAALRQVEFRIDRVSGARLAGVSIERIRNYQDLSALDVARIGTALAAGNVPMDFELHLRALNPADNTVPARLLQMDWTLLLEDRETVSGRVDREFVFEPGVAADLPIGISLDLADFFQSNARDLIELALAVSGGGGAPKRIALRATPTIQTSIGPIRYPQPITIVSEEVGGR
jgi:hypothetical protein